MRRYLAVAAGLAFVGALTVTLQAQKSPAKTPANKLCVADVANSSMIPIHVHDVKDHWIDELKKQQLSAESASTATAVAKSLDISGNNRDSIKLRKCDYLVLSEVDNPNLKPGESPKVTPALVFNYALFKTNIKPEKLLKEGSVPVPDPEKRTESVIGVLGDAAKNVAEAVHK